MVDVFGEFDGRVGHVLPFQRPVPGVVVDPGIRSGFPVIEGTRAGYDQVAGLMADNVPAEDIAGFFPSVNAEAARAAHRFANYVSKYAPRVERPSRLMKILLDENIPEPLSEPLTWLLRGHHMSHVNAVEEHQGRATLRQGQAVRVRHRHLQRQPAALRLGDLQGDPALQQACGVRGDQQRRSEVSRCGCGCADALHP